MKITDMPNEVIHHIMTYLNSSEIKTLIQTNSIFDEIGGSNLYYEKYLSENGIFKKEDLIITAELNINNASFIEYLIDYKDVNYKQLIFSALTQNCVDSLLILIDKYKSILIDSDIVKLYRFCIKNNLYIVFKYILDNFNVDYDDLLLYITKKGSYTLLRYIFEKNKAIKNKTLLDAILESYNKNYIFIFKFLIKKYRHIIDNDTKLYININLNNNVINSMFKDEPYINWL